MLYLYMLLRASWSTNNATLDFVNKVLHQLKYLSYYHLTIMIINVGETEYFRILSAVNARMGSIALVHIEDICSAHIFLMEHAKAEGRYICSSQSCALSDLATLLSKVYSNSNIYQKTEKIYDKVPSEISSKKLQDLGFSYKHDLEDIIYQTLMCCLDYGYLPPV